ncbi:MAG TPA: hypothetical protein VGZ22_22315 [Isosphaeraceae bacterium]|jgi:hypothetical protein|nr:hypothetical protein [Isosphaeraceae bacterium]
MNEKELAKALLGLDAERFGTAPDARELTRKILARDRRRVRILTCFTGFLWTLAALTILLSLYAFLVVSPEHRQFMYGAGHKPHAAPDLEHMQRIYYVLIEKAMVHVVFSVVALTLAAFGTIILIFASHRATLRQVNASLAEISEQLKQLRQPGAS